MKDNQKDPFLPHPISLSQLCVDLYSNASDSINIVIFFDKGEGCKTEVAFG